jgi:hypothetical protein
MCERRKVFVERMLDVGQWFEPGVRAEYFRAEHDPRLRALESAALGSYEVIGCRRVRVDEQRWLDVSLRPFFDA